MYLWKAQISSFERVPVDIGQIYGWNFLHLHMLSQIQSWEILLISTGTLSKHEICVWPLETVVSFMLCYVFMLSKYKYLPLKSWLSLILFNLLLLLEDQLVFFNMNGLESEVALERWKWTLTHRPSRLCHILVSSDWWVWGWPFLEKK